jgi:diguanylate cyclase (GGDEF)-like protein
MSMKGQPMSNHWKLRMLLVLAVSSITAAVLTVTTVERSEERRASRQLIDGQQMGSALVQAHAALYSFAGDRADEDAVEFGTQQRAYAAATRDAFAADDERSRRASLSRQNALASSYFRRGEAAIAAIRSSGFPALTPRRNDALVSPLSRFERENAAYLALIQREREAGLTRARWLASGLVVLLSLTFAAIGQLLLSRSQRSQRSRGEHEREQRENHREFSEVLQLTESEAEAYGLIKRHLERSLPGSVVTVMSRNNSRDRLEARTELPPGSEVSERLLDAEPRSCLAIRQARERSHSARRPGLLSCSVCGALEYTTCVPSLVSGEVIGSVLVEHAQPLGESEHEQVLATVAQAAPTLGNLRNLALAESRALTDALTGLPNTRAVYDTLKRMLAQASRTLNPLSAVMLDLDHFKQINDTLGHEKGDEALAAVGDALASSTRAGDFAGRYGGEEFVVLLPDTDKAGALELAEKLRLAVSLLRVPGTERPLTTSCGVASYPADAQDPERLLRLADRALYAAKAAGRNRVAEATSNDDRSETFIADAPTQADRLELQARGRQAPA